MSNVTFIQPKSPRNSSEVTPEGCCLTDTPNAKCVAQPQELLNNSENFKAELSAGNTGVDLLRQSQIDRRMTDSSALLTDEVSSTDMIVNTAEQPTFRFQNYFQREIDREAASIPSKELCGQTTVRKRKFEQLTDSLKTSVRSVKLR